MALIKSVKGKKPSFGNSNWLADNATVVGDVSFGDNCSVWFNAVVRGDVNGIVFGDFVNIQDGAVIHCTYEKTTVNIGSNVSIGHNAIVHGANIEDNVLIGMGAIVMDNCHIKSNVIIAAGAVLLENTVVEEGSLYAGVPAKFIKKVAKEMITGEIERIAKNYPKYASWIDG